MLIQCSVKMVMYGAVHCTSGTYSVQSGTCTIKSRMYTVSALRRPNEVCDASAQYRAATKNI